jgi:predicted RecA/RadA family phage recombinase
MADASYVRGDSNYNVTLAAAASAGEVRQLSNGLAAVMQGLNSASSGDTRTFRTEGQHALTKATGVVLLDGGKAFWDHSANNVTFRKVNDRDFYVGTVVGDAASGDTTCVVNLNVLPKPQIDLLRDGALSVATGTAAAGGFGLPALRGGVPGLQLTATNEAQCVDLLSVDRVAVSSNPIAEFVVRMAANGSDSTVDFNVGLANATNTTDADTIAESCFFHIDGGALTIFAESDDGTTEVAATTTTVSITAGSAVANRVEFWLDARDPANVRYYIDGAEVNAATSNLGNINVAAGPLGLLVHLEKTVGTATAGPFYIDRAELRTMEQ